MAFYCEDMARDSCFSKQFGLHSRIRQFHMKRSIPDE